MTATLVFVHGFLGGAAQWTRQKEALRAQFDVVTAGLPGFGEQRDMKAPTSIEGFARCVLSELTAHGSETFHLIGHSMGGMIAQEMTAQAPARIEKLILYGTGPRGLLPGRFETIDETRARARSEGSAATARRIAATWFVDGESSPAYPDCARIAVQASMQAIDAGLAAMEGWSGVANLAGISAPTLVLWGDRDRSYPWSEPEMLWKTIPGARLAVVPDSAHAVHLERPGLFNDLVAGFLA